MALAQMARSIWGPTPEVMRWAYIGIVRPVMAYACLIWGHEIHHAGIRKALLQLNRLAMSLYASAHRSTPTRVLEIMTNTMPLHLFILSTALATYVRVHSVLPTVDWTGSGKRKTFNTCHLQFWLDRIRDKDLLDLLTESDVTSAPMPPQKYKVECTSSAGTSNAGAVHYLY